MPTRALAPCLHPGCPHLGTHRGRCAAHHDANERNRKRAADQHRPNASQRGYDSAWEKARRSFLERNPWCHYCAERGVQTKATCVDHGDAHKGNRRVFWNKAMWRPACGPCNSRKCAEREGGFGNPVRRGTAA